MLRKKIPPKNFNDTGYNLLMITVNRVHRLNFYYKHVVLWSPLEEWKILERLYGFVQDHPGSERVGFRPKSLLRFLMKGHEKKKKKKIWPLTSRPVEE